MCARTLLVFSIFLASSVWAQQVEFVGPESCKACHPDAYSIWMSGKHSRAKESLSPTQQQDARCVSCHSPNESAAGVPHVTCETCHGGGHHYAADYVMRDAELARLVGLVDPTEKACRTCHDDSSPSLKGFQFVDKLKLIDHWTVERQKRAKSAGSSPPSKKK